MINQLVSWVDPIENKTLVLKDNFLVNNSGKFLVKNKIPIFVQNLKNQNQIQVQKAFGFKWKQNPTVTEDYFFQNNLKEIYYDMMGLDDNVISLFENKIILDVGVGSGSSAKLWAPYAKEFHGIDISEAIFEAKNTLKEYGDKIILSQADLNSLPYENESFDFLVSNGVLHHTENTKKSLERILRKLKFGGYCLFYIYKIKSPIREFSDDLIREKISDMEPNSALEELKSITEFAKSLSEQSIKINVPKDIRFLGIEKGHYDLQLFIYQYFFKCFWNKNFGFDISNLTNFDWYYPKFSWRHSKEEIYQWCEDFSLKPIFIKEKMSGYATLVQKI